ncbi:MAG: hypothetical protein ACYS26_06930 [Planctomycetota bacterium]|jgi:hypothetical protein
MNGTPWSAVGERPPTDLEAARLTMHYAAQPLAAAAYALLPAVEDHSHSNLLWSAARDGFLGRPLPGGLRTFMDPVGLRLGLLDAAGAEVSALALASLTLDQALAEFADLLRRADAALPASGLGMPAYDLPESPLRNGAAFTVDAAASRELARWFGDAHAALAGVAEERLGGAEVRGWPHHFDLAALVSLDPDRDPESARSVGAGFSPGDGSYPEPYFYVSPWPAPAPAALPKLGAGAHWHTTGFTSAILPAGAVVAERDARSQRRLVEDFLARAVDASFALLEG